MTSFSNEKGYMKVGIMEAYVIYDGCFLPLLLGKAHAVSIGDERILSCSDKKILKYIFAEFCVV